MARLHGEVDKEKMASQQEAVILKAMHSTEGGHPQLGPKALEIIRHFEQKRYSHLDPCVRSHMLALWR